MLQCFTTGYIILPLYNRVHFSFVRYNTLDPNLFQVKGWKFASLTSACYVRSRSVTARRQEGGRQFESHSPTMGRTRARGMWREGWIRFIEELRKAGENKAKHSPTAGNPVPLETEVKITRVSHSTPTRRGVGVLCFYSHPAGIQNRPARQRDKGVLIEEAGDLKIPPR